MAVLENITQMKNQGMSTSQIIQTLKQQGISPKEINESLSQSEIKSELNRNPQENPLSETNPNFQNSQPNQYPQSQQSSNFSTQPSTNLPASNQQMQTTEMQPSISSQPTGNIPQNFPQQTNQEQTFPQSPSLQQPQENQEFETPQQYPQAEQYQEYSPTPYPEYEQYPEYQPPQATDIETISDISTQIIEEKTQKLKKEILSFTRFQKESQEKIKELDKRLTRIESIIDNLQIAIIKKIGEHSEDIKNISKEIKATQNSFSKMTNPLTDNLRALQKITGEPNPEQPKEQHEEQQSENSKKQETSRKKSKKPAPSFEDYLR